METIIKTQEQLDIAIKNIAMIANVYYDSELNFNPIDWEKEFVKITNDNGKTIVERIEY